jgi:DNA-binding protein YbaB
MFSLIPDFVLVLLAWAAAVGGVVLYVASKLVRWIPMMGMYKMPAEIAGVVLLTGGAWMLGGQAADQRWQAKVDEVQAKLKVAEEQSKEANVEIQNKAEAKIKYIRGRTEVVKEYIDREVVKYDTKFAPGGECAIPKEFVRAHNDAAEAPKK